MEILFEDPQIIVAVKPPEMISEQSAAGDGFADLLTRRNKGYIGVVSRLDRGVGGVMVYAKTPAAASMLSRAVQEHQLQKEYLAITEGTPKAPFGELRDLLYYDRATNKVFRVSRMRRGVKEAVLHYRALKTVAHPETGAALTLVLVRLLTGRTHQIRVQFSSRGLPLLGDRRYGGTGKTGISLWCRGISLPAMGNTPERCFAQAPDGIPWTWFSDTLDAEIPKADG